MLHLNSVVLFLFNNHNFVNKVWGDTGLEGHFQSKLDGLVERHGNLAGTVSFLAELSQDNLKKVEEFIKDNHTSSEHKKEEAAKRASHYLSNDVEDIPSILERLAELGEEEMSQPLNTALEDILVWGKIADHFTVEQFLDHIDY